MAPPSHRNPAEPILTTIHAPAAMRSLWPEPLADQWRRMYPGLFDDDDLRLALSQPDYHRWEWFVAIHLFQRDGACSLLEKYMYGNHPGKVARIEEVLSAGTRSKLQTILAAHAVQPPDLFVYLPDSHRFWFAEVKGPGDRLSPKQHQSHAAIMRELRVPVEIVQVRL